MISSLRALRTIAGQLYLEKCWAERPLGLPQLLRAPNIRVALHTQIPLLKALTASTILGPEGD